MCFYFIYVCYVCCIWFPQSNNKSNLVWNLLASSKCFNSRSSRHNLKINVHKLTLISWFIRLQVQSKWHPPVLLRHINTVILLASSATIPSWDYGSFCSVTQWFLLLLAIRNGLVMIINIHIPSFFLIHKTVAKFNASSVQCLAISASILPQALLAVHIEVCGWLPIQYYRFDA